VGSIFQRSGDYLSCRKFILISNFYTKNQQVLKNRPARGRLYLKIFVSRKNEIVSFTLYIVCQGEKNTISAISLLKKANPLKAFLKESLKNYYRSIINYKAIKKVFWDVIS
jgi:hypothetical protein